MVVFQLMGGLGNQMFAYAAGQAFAERTKLPISFDFDCPYPHVKYEYALDIFNIDRNFASRKDLRLLKPKKGIERRVLKALGRNTKRYLIKEKKEFTFDDSFFSIADNAYVSGFFQSEKYFSTITSTIRSAFSFKAVPDSDNATMLKAISSCNAVSIHVRRGDYVNVVKTKNTHGACSLEYYQQAIDYIASKVTDPVFFFFSNDIPWVKENIQTKHPHQFVDFNSGSKSYEDMRLMSHCKHHIIANSSFSWWGAWLNENPNKFVIAPKQWMNDPAIQTPDLLPASWIKM
jgi:hypothetical protein